MEKINWNKLTIEQCRLLSEKDRFDLYALHNFNAKTSPCLHCPFSNECKDHKP